jgi:ribosome-associated protein
MLKQARQRVARCPSFSIHHSEFSIPAWHSPCTQLKCLRIAPRPIVPGGPPITTSTTPSNPHAAHAAGSANDPSVRRFALAAAAMAFDTRCDNVRLLDLRGRSDVTSYLLLATGSSARQMRTAVDEMRDLGKTMEHKAWQTNGYDGAKWIVIDFVHVVAHVFEADARDFYDLETLWGDCPEIDWRDELGLPPDALRKAEDRADNRFLAEEAIDDSDEENKRLGADGQDDDDDELDDGDPDTDEDAELDAPIVTEVPDESTGSNSVSFIEIDPPAHRRGKNRASFPVTLPESDDDDEFGGRAVEKVSLDEDDQEAAAEAQADGDPEAVSSEDLPENRVKSRPMGGVSASLSSTHITDEDEQDQEGSFTTGGTDPDAAGEGLEDEPAPLDEDASTPLIPKRRKPKAPVKPVPAKRPAAASKKPAAKKAPPKKIAPKKSALKKAAARKAPAKKPAAAKKSAKAAPKKPAPKPAPKSKATAKPKAKPKKKMKAKSKR